MLPQLHPALRQRFPDVAEGPGETNLVSVIIPVYNRAVLLRRAMASVARQTWRPIEAIVVDDGSVDDVGSVVAEYAEIATMVRQQNAGVTAARNHGLRIARGEFVAFLDSDDMWDPGKIQAQVQLLRARPDVIMVWTDMRAIDESGDVCAARYLRAFYGSTYDRIDKGASMPVVSTLQSFVPDCLLDARDAPVRIGHIFADMWHGNLVHTSTVVVRRTRIVAGGGFDPSLARTGEDYEFHLRTCYFGPVALIEAPMVSYRVGAADQLTSPEWAFARARNALTAVTYWLGAATQLKDRPRSDLTRRLAELELQCGERSVLFGGDQGTAYLLAGLRRMPLTPRAWVLLALSLLPSMVRRSLLSAWRSRPSWMHRRQA